MWYPSADFPTSYQYLYPRNSSCKPDLGTISTRHLPSLDCGISAALGEAMREPVQRRLAAILAADVVGSSRLIEADEGYALTAIREVLHDVLVGTAASHGGRLIKTMGDGALLEFASPVAAVTCATAVQYRRGTVCSAQGRNAVSRTRSKPRICKLEFQKRPSFCAKRCAITSSPASQAGSVPSYRGPMR